MSGGLSGKVCPVLLIALLLQIVFVFHLFPPDVLLSAAPIVTEDYPIHYYNLYRMRQALLGGRLNSYDPHFSLGEGASVLDIPRGIDLLVLSVMLFWMGPLTVLKLYVLLANLAVPLIMYHCSRNFGFSTKASQSAALLSALAWQFVGLIHHMLYSGVFSYILGCYVSLYAASFLYSYAVDGRRRGLAFSLIAAVLAISMHRLSVVTLLVLVTVVAAVTGKTRLLALPALLALISAIGLLVDLGDISLHLATMQAPIFHQSAGLATLIGDFTTLPFQTWFLVTGAAGIILMRKNAPLFRLGAATSILFLLLAYFGTLIPGFAYIQPQRMLVPALLMLTLFAGEAIAGLKGVLQVRYLSAVPLIVLLAVLVLPGYRFFESAREGWDLQLTSALPEDTAGLILWIQDRTTNEGRILIENSGYKTGFVFGGHTLPLFPLSADRQFAGGYYPYIQAKEGYFTADYSEGRIFNREVGAFTEDQLRELLALFNIRWVVSWSETGILGLRQFPSLLVEEEGSPRGFRTFRVNQTPTYFLEGGGEADATGTGLRLTNLTAGRIILKYRYQPWLRSEEGIVLERFPVAGTYESFLSFTNEGALGEVVLTP